MKFKTLLAAHKGLVKDIVTSTCLLGGSAGVVFGVSAGTFKIEYMDLNNADNRLAGWQNNNYFDQRISSKWNMTKAPAVTQQTMTDSNDWKSWHPGAKTIPFDVTGQTSWGLHMDIPEGQELEDEQIIKNRKKHTCIVIDGAAHSIMDRSFNQSLFEGIVDFNNNISVKSYSIDDANAYKPSQDNTTEMINTYMSCITQTRERQRHYVVGLAGFNHATPLQTMFPKTDSDGYALCANDDTNREAQSGGFILLDANVPDNQCVASVLFRADQPGFLTGLATGEYLINNLQMYHDHYQDLAVAAFGGVSIHTVTVYMGGFQRGIELFNKGVIGNSVETGAKGYFGLGATSEDVNWDQCCDTFERKLLKHSKYKSEIEAIKNDPSLDTPTKKYQEYLRGKGKLKDKIYEEYSIKMIKLGDSANHFSGTFAAGDAIGITKQYLNRGASAIIAVAGPQSLDAAQEIKNQHSNAVVIGVDTAMEDGDYQRYHDGCDVSTDPTKEGADEYYDQMTDSGGNHSAQSHGIIKFSAIKDLKTVANKITRLICSGQNWDVGNEDNTAPDPERGVCGPGFTTCGNIRNGLISISWDGFVPLIEALKHMKFWGDLGEGTKLASFEAAWTFAVGKYKDMIGEDEWGKIDSGYIDPTDGIFKIENACTFKRTDDSGNESVFYKNYFRTISILGQFMECVQLEFDNDMSLMPIFNEKGEIIGFEKMKKLDEKLSLSEWLDYNMYFTC